MTAARTLRGLALAAGLAFAPLAAPAQSLSDAMVLAYDNSDILLQQRNLLRALDEDVAQAVALLRPTISYFGSMSKSVSDTLPTTTSATLGLVLEYVLADGGRRGFRIGAAKEAVLGARWALLQVEQTVLLDAIQAYLGLALAAQVVDVSQNNVRVITQQLRAARDRFEVGEVTRTDVAIAEARLAAAESALAAARGDVDVQRELYRLATGQLPGPTLAPLPAPPELPPALERAQDLAVQINPTIRQLQHEVTANQLLVEFARAERLPTVTVEGQVQRTDPAIDGASLGFRVGGPIYTGGRLSSIERQAVANLNATRAGLAQQARVVTDAVGRAWAQLLVAQAQIVASTQQVRSAQLAFEGFREEAALGARTTLDVLDAEQEVLDARVTLLEAQTNAQFAVYQVLAAIGLLTVDHLGLRVERYDPDAYYSAVRTAPATRPVLPSAQGNRLDRVLRRFGRN